MGSLVKFFSITLVSVAILSCATSGAPPIQSREAPPSKRINIHEVETGDTLYSVAWRYEADYREMARINGLYEPYELSRGQKLKIYDDGLPPPINYGNERYAGYGSSGNTSNPRGGGARTAPVTVSSATVSSGVGSSSVVVDTPNQTPRASDTPAVKLPPPSAPSPAAPSVSVVVEAPAPPPAPAPSVVNAEPRASDSSSMVFSDEVAEWQWPVNGKIIKSFGSDSLTKGIVMEPTSGEFVTSAADGVVVYAGDGMRGLGNLLIVKHSNLFLSAYAYNDQLLSKEGDRVHLGQEIAKIGKGADGDKRVYFEVRKDGKPVDPISYLPRR